MLYNRWLSLSTHIRIDISNSYQVCAFHSDCIPLWSTSPSELWQQHTLSSSSSPSSSVGNLLLNASNGSQYLSTLSNGVERSSLYTKATFRCLFEGRRSQMYCRCLKLDIFIPNRLGTLTGSYVRDGSSEDSILSLSWREQEMNVLSSFVFWHVNRNVSSIILPNSLGNRNDWRGDTTQ